MTQTEGGLTRTDIGLWIVVTVILIMLSGLAALPVFPVWVSVVIWMCTVVSATCTLIAAIYNW